MASGGFNGVKSIVSLIFTAVIVVFFMLPLIFRGNFPVPIAVILPLFASIGSFMMLIWGFQMHYRQYINIPLIQTEIMQSLAGSIGIVLTVPVTIFFSVTLYAGSPAKIKKRKH